jgi:hypothetical protein
MLAVVEVVLIQEEILAQEVLVVLVEEVMVAVVVLKEVTALQTPEAVQEV